MQASDLNKNSYLILRIAAAMCFIGHGAFGIITKEIWCNYFGVFGVSHDMAYTLMPIVGCVDIFLGIAMLVYPVRAIPAWLVIWGIVTALLRPLSGEPFAEFIERAGNFGAPLTLLILVGIPKNWKDWFRHININRPIQKATNEQYVICLRVICFLLLSGHGWLNLISKKALLGQYTSIGFSNPVQVAQKIGSIEIIAAVVILIRPFRSLVMVIFLWKMASEIFYPHYKIFEWIERSGSYGVLLALWVMLKRKVLFTTKIDCALHSS